MRLPENRLTAWLTNAGPVDGHVYLFRWVVAAAEVRTGYRVLDVSTGTGEAAIGVLQTVGPSGD